MKMTVNSLMGSLQMKKNQGAYKKSPDGDPGCLVFLRRKFAVKHNSRPKYQ